MFKSRATFQDGPCQGRTSTVHSESPKPPGVIYVHTATESHRYIATAECDPRNPVYQYDGGHE